MQTTNGQRQRRDNWYGPSSKVSAIVPGVVHRSMTVPIGTAVLAVTPDAACAMGAGAAVVIDVVKRVYAIMQWRDIILQNV